MGEFGNTAVKAARRLQDDKNLCPEKAWNKAISEANLSRSSQEKGCPKSAFLGLCRKGLIVKTGPYDKLDESKNGDYAVIACEILIAKQNRPLPTQKALWEKVFQNLNLSSISQNGQLDVVFSLWREKLIGR